jgi:hypothetical protein
MIDKKILNTILEQLFNGKVDKSIVKKYFYIEDDKFCCDKLKIKELADIPQFDYKKVIEELVKYNPNIKYYESLLKFANKIKKDTTFLNFSLENDEIMSYYIQSRPKCSVITLFPNAILKDEYKEKFFATLEENGAIYYLKSVLLSFNAILNLLYNIYLPRKSMKDFNDIMKMAKEIGAKENNDNLVHFIFFEPKKSITIDKLASKLQNIWKKDLNLKGNLLLDTTNNFGETIDFGRFILNKNSIDSLFSANLFRHLHNYNLSSKILLNTIKNVKMFYIKMVHY